MDGINTCFSVEHGTCPTCGRCRCCGQYAFTFPDLNVTTVVVPSHEDVVRNIMSEGLDTIDKLLQLIGNVRGDSSFPIDRKTVEDIINEQTD